MDFAIRFLENAKVMQIVNKMIAAGKVFESNVF